MPPLIRLPDPVRLPGLIALATGVALVLAAAVRFIAWNWPALPDTARFGLAGGGMLLCLLLAFAAERRAGFSPGKQGTAKTDDSPNAMASASPPDTSHTGTGIPGTGNAGASNAGSGTAEVVPSETGGLAGAAAGLAMLGAGLCTGLFWAVFAQTFQSGATERDFCLVWAACVVPLFVLRRSAGLWNLLVVLLCGAACNTALSDLWYAAGPGLLLRLGGVAAVCCVAAPKRNAWLALPLTVLIGAATWLCSLALMELVAPCAYGPRISGAALFAGPVALAAVLAFALRAGHGLALGGLALSALVLLNVLVLYAWPFHSLIAMLAVFLLVNLAWLSALTMLLHHGLRRLHRPGTPDGIAATLCLRLPAALGGLTSALCLLGLITLLLAEWHLDMAVPMAAVGLVLLLGGTTLWRMRGSSTLAATCALVLACGGLIGLHLELYGHNPALILGLVWGASALFYAGMDMPLLRFAAIFAALWTSFVTLQDAGLGGFLSVPAVCCLLPLGLATAGRFPRGALRPAALACILTPALLSPRLPLPFQLHLTPDLLGGWLPSALLTLNLALLIRRRLPRQSPASPRPAEYAAAVLVLLPGWYACPPECLLAVNLLFASLAGTVSPATEADETGRTGIRAMKAAAADTDAAQPTDPAPSRSKEAVSAVETPPASASGASTAKTGNAGTSNAGTSNAGTSNAGAADATPHDPETHHAGASLSRTVPAATGSTAADGMTAGRTTVDSPPANGTIAPDTAGAAPDTAATRSAGSGAVQAAETGSCRAPACDATLLVAGLLLLAASLTGFYVRLKLPHMAYVLSLAGPGICLMGAGLWLNRRLRQAAGIRRAQPSARPPLLRHALPFALVAAVLTAAGGAAIADRSAILREGRDVLLALRPTDPHALLMGDYMDLEYELDWLIPDATGPGCLPLHPDAAGHPQTSPEAFIPDSDCKGVPTPALCRKKAASGLLFFDLPRRYYFEAGQARQYEHAAFAVLRCDRTSRCLLAGLAGKDGKRLGPAR